jgi:transcriptional regulator with XRE-family HTH domain
VKLNRGNLIWARERLGYSIEAVAEKAGIAKNSVLRADHGEDIRPLTARKIAAALDVSVADLYEEAEYPKGSAPPSPEPSFEDMLDEERREAVYGPWLDFVNRYAERWQRRIEAGELDLGSLEEFQRVIEDLFPTLQALEASERRELAAEGYQETYLHSKAGTAIGRLMSLFNPMLAAAAEKFPQEVFQDELEPLRRKREEMRLALERSA